MRFEYVGIRVTNLTRSVRFYTRALGLKVVRRDDCRGWGGGIAVVLQDPRSRRVLELNWYPEGSAFARAYRSGEELDHLDVSVGRSGPAALERAYRRLLRCGGRPTAWTPRATGGWAASVQDPDGVWIRLGRRPTRSELRTSAR